MQRAQAHLALFPVTVVFHGASCFLVELCELTHQRNRKKVENKAVAVELWAGPRHVCAQGGLEIRMWHGVSPGDTMLYSGQLLRQ